MSKKPLQLSELRKIGWSIWDPIGIADISGRPGDEYDRYLVQASGIMRREKSVHAAADFLHQIATEHMGCSIDHRKSIAAAEALFNYLQRLDAGESDALR